MSNQLMNVGSNVMSIGYDAGFAYLQGVIAGGGIISAGRVWTVISGSTQPVSELMGHVGTVTCLRQLAVGYGIAVLIASCLCKIIDKITSRDTRKNPPISFKVCVHVIYNFSCAVGVLAAFLVRTDKFKPIEFVLVVGTIAKMIFDAMLVPASEEREIVTTR